MKLSGFAQGFGQGHEDFAQGHGLDVHTLRVWEKIANLLVSLLFVETRVNKAD